MNFIFSVGSMLLWKRCLQPVLFGMPDFEEFNRDPYRLCHAPLAGNGCCVSHAQSSDNRTATEGDLFTMSIIISYPNPRRCALI